MEQPLQAPTGSRTHKVWKEGGSMGLWEDFVPLIRAGLDEQIAMGTKVSPVGVVTCTVKYEDRIALVCRYLDPTSEAYRLAQRFLNEPALYLAANQAPIPPQPTIPFNNVGGVFVKPQPGGPERPMYFTTAAVLICMLSVPLATTGQALVTAMMQIYRKSGVSPQTFFQSWVHHWNNAAQHIGGMGLTRYHQGATALGCMFIASAGRTNVWREVMLLYQQNKLPTEWVLED